jgi:hypothetical protein
MLNKALHDVAMRAAAADVAAYLCQGLAFTSDEEAAAETATRFAQAVAQASVYCEVSGDSTSYYAHANKYAVQTAEAWLAAYNEAFASSNSCIKCEYYQQSWGYVEQYVFLEVVANASTAVRAPLACVSVTTVTS